MALHICENNVFNVMLFFAMPQINRKRNDYSQKVFI